MVCSLLFLSISLKTALPKLDSSVCYLLSLQCKTTLLTTDIFFHFFFFLAQERTQNNMRDLKIQLGLSFKYRCHQDALRRHLRSDHSNHIRGGRGCKRPHFSSVCTHVLDHTEGLPAQLMFTVKHHEAAITTRKKGLQHCLICMWFTVMQSTCLGSLSLLTIALCCEHTVMFVNTLFQLTIELVIN